MKFRLNHPIKIQINSPTWAQGTSAGSGQKWSDEHCLDSPDPVDQPHQESVLGQAKQVQACCRDRPAASRRSGLKCRDNDLALSSWQLRPHLHQPLSTFITQNKAHWSLAAMRSYIKLYVKCRRRFLVAMRVQLGISFSVQALDGPGRAGRCCPVNAGVPSQDCDLPCKSLYPGCKCSNGLNSCAN